MAGVAKASAGIIYSEDGAASLDKVFKSGAPEWESSMGRSSREADQVRHDRNGEAEGALPDVDRPEPAVERAQIGMVGWVASRLQAARPWGRALPTFIGDTRPMARQPSVADGVADGGMPWDYKRDRTRPMAEPVMLSRSRETTVTDSNLLGPQEGSLALPRVRR